METKDTKGETKPEIKTGAASTENAQKTGSNDAPKVQAPSKVSDETDTMRFPLEVDNIVYLRRVPMHSRLPGQNMDEAKLKIGGSYKGNSVLRGLTFAEEAKYLSSIMGLSITSPNWEKETRDYWANVSKDVPKDGIELNIGMRYLNAEDFIYDRDEAKKDVNGTIIEGKGIPVNLADYILWRYCLLYSRVANNFELVGMSPKIEFYLFSKQKEIADKKNTLGSKRTAVTLMFKRMAERDWVDYVLRVLVAKDKNFAKKYQVSDIGRITNDEKDILLDEYVTSDPDGFLVVANDKNLETRSFIELCIASGKLTRIPNTDTITQDGTPLGSTMAEVIAFFNNPKNAETVSILKAQIKHTPS